MIEKRSPSDTGEGRGEPLSREESMALLSTMDGKLWADAFCRLTGFPDDGLALAWFCNAIMAGYDIGRAKMERELASGGDQGVREAPEHVHEFHQFEVCKHCGLTEAAILDQCHHCDENKIGARCYWCLRVWNGQSGALLTPPVEPDKR